MRAFLPSDEQTLAFADEHTRSLSVSQLKVGMVLANDVLSTSGAVVVTAGREVTALILDRLRKFSEGVGIVEPVIVSRMRKV